MEVPPTCKAYFLGLCKGISPQNMTLYGTGPPVEDPEIPIDYIMIHVFPGHTHTHFLVTFLGEAKCLNRPFASNFDRAYHFTDCFFVD